jgi:hypothetical protein
MSSMKITTDLSCSGMNTELLRYMKCADTLVNPNDMTRGIGDIFDTNLDLVIAGVEINLGEHLGSSLLIEQEVNAGYGILVLDGDGIQQSVIHT